MSPFNDSPEGQTHSYDFCHGCHKEILWIETNNRKMMPVDPPVVTIITPDGHTIRGHVPHWSTCIAAERFKKK